MSAKFDGATISQSEGMDLWRTLARAGSKATAEALSAGEFERMHVTTPLDVFVRDRVASGDSVVLTGNAGDGKTHVLRRAAPELAAVGADVIEDATAAMRNGDPRPVLERWRAAHSAGRPFCLAINEHPLFQLHAVAPDFAPLAEVWRQCRARLSYGAGAGVGKDAANIVAIDLSLRNPLAPPFFEAVLDALLGDPEFQSSVSRMPGSARANNAVRLAEPNVRYALRTLLARAVSLGARSTVREVWILAARMLVGTNDGAERLRDDWYFQPLFAEDVRFPVLAALRAIDPANCSHPVIDDLLENKDAELWQGWRFDPPVPSGSSLSYPEFAWLKRAFHFEHAKGLEAMSLADPEALEFRALLEDPADQSRLVAGMVDAINAAYCPVAFPGRAHHLYLWSGHRFHEQPSRSFVAAERIGVDDLVILRPRLPERVAEAFPYSADHLMLMAKERQGARLRIDFPLFRTLRRLGRGLPRKLMPERELHRIDAFLERLGPSVPGARTTVWSAHLENLQVLEVGLAPGRRAFESVTVHG